MTDPNIAIPVIPGDGVGNELWAASQRVIDAAIKNTHTPHIKWIPLLAGQLAYEQTGEWLPNETLDTIKKHKIAIKGPLATPIGGGIRSLNVQLRKHFDLFCCIRPIRWFSGVPAPVKKPENINMVIFRENTEDTYCGIEWDYADPINKKLIKYLQNELNVQDIRFPNTSSIGLKPVSKEGSERLFESVFQYAKKTKRSPITIIHKGNIMKYTEGRFRDWGTNYLERHYPNEIFTWRDYQNIEKKHGKDHAKKAETDAIQNGKIIVNDCIADAFFQNALLYPERYNLVVATNLNGDYVSDALAAQVGGIGISPGANINDQTNIAIFEATHGTAPDIAGLNIANPCALLLSACMALRHIQYPKPADIIESAISDTIASKIVTADFKIADATTVGTAEFANHLIAKIKA